MPSLEDYARLQRGCGALRGGINEYGSCEFHVCKGNAMLTNHHHR